MAMSDEDFREGIKTVIRRHDPGPDELRSLADDLQELADRHEATQEVL